MLLKSLWYNGGMRNSKRGFTLVEISIFLAVTGLLFIGVTVGVQNSIFRQRYTDAVQNFADFLRNTYAGVINVQGVNGGRSDQAIYGKMIVFGESSVEPGAQLGEQSGEEQSEAPTAGQSGGGDYRIMSYDLVGNIPADGVGDGLPIQKLLKYLELKVPENGLVEEYSPKWGVSIQTTDPTGDNRYTGSIMIVRHPVSGKVYTLYGDSINVTSGTASKLSETFLGSLKDEDDINICVNPNGDEASSIRADVRIEKGATNASGVSIIMDSNDNRCRKNDG